MGNHREQGGEIAPLFRHQVIDAQSTRYLGTIRVARHPGFALVAGLSLLLAGALVAFGLIGEVSRKAKLSGLLSPVLGTLQLSAPQSGTVLERRVVEGQIVKAGDVLFVVGIDRATAHGDTAAIVAASLAQRSTALDDERTLHKQQARLHGNGIADKIRSLQAELIRAQGEANLARLRVELARKNTERYDQLARAGFVADVQSQAKQEEALDTQGRAELAQRNVIALQRELQGLHVEASEATTQLQADLAQLERSRATLDQEAAENDARHQLVVTAPQDATVGALSVSLGQAVAAGQTLATLVPNGTDGTMSRLGAELYAASRTAGFIEPGQRVWLRYAAYPYQKFGLQGGRITAVSRTPINPQDLPQGQQQALLSAAQSNEPLYRVSVALDAQTLAAYGRDQVLRPGLTLEADVVQDTRKIWEWLLEPVIAVRQRVKVLGARAKVEPDD